MAFLYRGGPQSPRDEPAPSPANPLSPSRNPNRFSGGMMLPSTGSDVRAGLSRRFTTNALPTLTPIGQQRRQAAGDYLPASAYNRKRDSESAVRRYEHLLAQQRELQRELDAVDPETRREVEQGRRHEESVFQMMASSEPPSPPEYASAFPTAFSRPNRYSAAALTSPPGISARPNRSSTQLTSPSVGLVRPYTSGNASSANPSQSVPGSRRQSDDEDDDFVYAYDSAIHRAAAKPNRNSMPITSYDRRRNDNSVLNSVNSSGFYFDESEDSNASGLQSNASTASPPDTKTFLQVQHTADGFPKLIRREDNVDLSSAALDLALAQGVDPQQQLSDRSAATRNRISLPPHALSSNGSIAPLNSILVNADRKSVTANNRRSLEVQFSAGPKQQRPTLFSSPPRAMANGNMAKSTSSYSTNDIPTLKSINGENTPGGVSLASPPTTAADPVSHESKTMSQVASPTNGHRQSQDLGIQFSRAEDQAAPEAYNSHAVISNHANPYAVQDGSAPAQFNPTAVSMNSPYAQPAPFYGGFNNMNMLSNNFGGMNLAGAYHGSQAPWPNAMPTYNQGGNFGGYQQFSNANQAGPGAQQRFNDNSQRNMTASQKRQAHEEALAKFNSINVEDIVGEIYGLCKDQHGCRFLQRKLDERDEKTVEIIFNDVSEHIIELMTDPFGNYLCQKLLEVSTNDQRTVLVKNASPSMTKIALNQHGTRALQKMIEYIETPEQTEIIIDALRYDVVHLIQDLNGNHVIQKCLNHLTSENATFIFQAVGQNCVTVGTHRHGCCVLQRCIDHATGLQKGQLVDRVIADAFALVQDPFGNYVVQYILDLSEPCFTEPLCESFLGSVIFLSRQKFSSNVMEKCLRCAGPETKKKLIYEIMSPNELEKLLRDSFANYVVQTAMDFGDEDTKALLIENIRPILPSIRHTPYGRRIQSKLQEYDNKKLGGGSGGLASPQVMTTTPAGPLPYPAQNAPVGRGNRHGFVGPPPSFNGLANGFNNATFSPGAFQPHDSTSQRNNGMYQQPQGFPGNFGGNNFNGSTYNGNNTDRPAPYGHF